jgi:hypothetical protein
MSYPYKFLEVNECFEYASIEALMEKIDVEIEMHNGRIATALRKSWQILHEELKIISETALIRHLEWFAESLNEEVEVDKFNNFIFEGKLYSGILYREKMIDGTWIYYKSPTKNTVEILYAKNGDVLHYDLSKNVVQYLLEDKWYIVQTDSGKHVFNLMADNPVAIKNEGVPSKFCFPIEAVSHMIYHGGIVTEMI